MFNKKSCSNCGNKLDNKYRFCPYCGSAFNDNYEKDLGMLGDSDFRFPDEEIKLPMGINTLFNSLMKNLNKQFLELEKTAKKPSIKKTGVSISISSFGDSPPEIKVNSFGNNPSKKQIKKIPVNNISRKRLQKFSNLPKQEPLTKIRRLSNKVIYEIDIPGVDSIKDVSIIVLENSIEIKAFAKDKVYFKLIPINLPITNYEISDGKLILELGEKN